MSAASQKGCYNCMKRRIKCDQARPHCAKCAKKGLECSGYGIRYRFKDANPARLQAGATPVEQDPIINVVDDLNLGTDTLNFTSEDASVSHYPNGEELNELIRDDWQAQSFDADVGLDIYQAGQHTRIHQDSVTFYMSPNSSLTPQVSFLFDHFSKHVSPVMILLDGRSNGYRNEVLPFGVQNEVAQRAISVVSALHLTSSMPELRVPAEAGRHAIIAKLQQDASRMDGTFSFDVTTWVVILLLIVGDLITGNEDVRVLFRLLRTYMKGKPAFPSTALTAFLDYQTQVIDFFACPVLSETEGLVRYNQGVEVIFDFAGDHGADLFMLLYSEAYRQTQSIYLLRARSAAFEIDEADISGRVTRLAATLLELDPFTPGAHALVWPYFVGAAESKVLSEREFFCERLRFIWLTTGYNNVKVALEELEKIWERPFERWTSYLSGLGTIVM